MQIERATTYVKNVNFRRQKAGDEEGAIACDLTVAFNTEGPMFMSQMAVEDPPGGWKDLLWDKDGHIRGLCIESMKLYREFTGLEMTIEAVQGDLFEDGQDTLAGIYVNVRKIVVEPQNGWTLDVSCQLQTEPPQEVWDNLPALIKEKVAMTLLRDDTTGANDGDAGMAEDEAAAEG